MKKVLFRSDICRLEKDGQYYRVYPYGKRKPIGSFLLLSQAENYISEYTNRIRPSLTK